MTMQPKPTMLALAALLLCAACSNQTTTAQLDSSEKFEMSSIRWDEAIAAKQVARVSNGNLIMMR